MDMDPVDFFRTMHSAFARVLAVGGRPEVVIDRLVTQAFELFEQNIAIQTEGLPALACEKNCPSCCTLRVTATAPEIFLLARYVRLIHASAGGTLVNLPKRITQANRATKGLDERQRMAIRQPCPFVLRGVCVIHPVRPLACRGHASFDRTACARAAKGRNVEVPVSEPHLNLRALVQNALQSALRGAGLAWGLYELNHALALALDREDRRTAWVNRSESLAPMIADVDMAAMAATFDTLLAT
jgi:Fe-S-cluster containining protein